ncbi:MAG: hypothetical protein C0594_03805 [Marinilabiliales bacterium]|nr:MAG: hypothetical protein C0594_03805 [Marinilabiliales bacterium]
MQPVHFSRMLFVSVFILVLHNVTLCQKLTIPEEYKDPTFPEYKDTGNKEADHKNYRKAILQYSEDHPPFPKFVNTGNPEKDQEYFEKRKAEWYKQNPYCPMYVSTGHEKQDLENYNKALLEWSKKNPEKYKAILKSQHAEELPVKLQDDDPPPKFQDTGNREEDNRRYKAAKEEWLHRHPEKRKP